MGTWWERLWQEHPGLLLGGAAGFAFAVLVLVVGFWRAVLVAALVIIGGYVGRRFDGDDSDLGEILDRIFNRSERE
jgi:uncharacterized membrane protein